METPQGRAVRQVVAIVLVGFDHIAGLELGLHGDGNRFIVRADEMVRAFLEAERAIYQFAATLTATILGSALSGAPKD